MDCDCKMINYSIKKRKEVGGITTNPYYNVWKSIVQRTCNFKHEHFHLYGGRGIGICDQWRRSFKEFIKSMPKERNLSLTVDRINNNKGYCPHNVKLSSGHDQHINKRYKNPTGYRGVYRSTTEGKFFSQLSINGNYVYLGTFDSAKDAYSEFKKLYFEWHGKQPLEAMDGK